MLFIFVSVISRFSRFVCYRGSTLKNVKVLCWRDQVRSGKRETSHSLVLNIKLPSFSVKGNKQLIIIVNYLICFDRHVAMTIVWDMYPTQKRMNSAELDTLQNQYRQDLLHMYMCFLDQAWCFFTTFIALNINFSFFFKFFKFFNRTLKEHFLNRTEIYKLRHVDSSFRRKS